MAESIAILVKKATWTDLVPMISGIAEKIGELEWRYPRNDKEYTITLYESNSWINDCDDEDIDEIVLLLGDFPTVVLCLELRRTRQNKACDDAKEICIPLLSSFDGIIDDCLGKFWILNEIDSDTRFLDEYRYGKV